MAWKLQPKYKSWSEWAREVLANASVQAIQAAEAAKSEDFRRTRETHS